jgi:hypothetical protein
VTPEQKQQALDTLRERFRKGAEQHKARLLAQQQEQQTTGKARQTRGKVQCSISHGVLNSQ